MELKNQVHFASALPPPFCSAEESRDKGWQPMEGSYVCPVGGGHAPRKVREACPQGEIHFISLCCSFALLVLQGGELLPHLSHGVGRTERGFWADIQSALWPRMTRSLVRRRDGLQGSFFRSQTCSVWCPNGCSALNPHTQGISGVL